MDITGTINAEMSKMARSMRNGVDMKYCGKCGTCLQEA